ncbi:MAG TPA: hypothetical protein PKL14_11365 [Holophaga sp.]|nr:hypothetical protein [Holophaga sp.]
MSNTIHETIRLARSMNLIAGQLLKLDLPIDQRETDPDKGKISLGLSLQASELAAKSILSTIEWSRSKIRKHFSDHDLYKLLNAVESEIQKSNSPKSFIYRNFLLQCVEVDNVKSENTIGHFLSRHFSHPNSSHRNYFYSDCTTFLAPKPFNAIHAIADKLIHIAQDLATT